jgi:hypothetical protein
VGSRADAHGADERAVSDVVDGQRSVVVIGDRGERAAGSDRDVVRRAADRKGGDSL